ncbi:hypothetical protein RJ639_002753 [Escallonia herrerae]|uniref:GOLD domain-containing protein n=1 Tax=Escallonia herrerae TaxID=1293975 RepID=A0AA88W1N1_9ASTE|nr:hypothetical protein RJ639_002753 [Escallonia herrerae]
MASTEGLVPITRNYLASYYDKYPFPPISDDVSRLTAELSSMSADFRMNSTLPEAGVVINHVIFSVPWGSMHCQLIAGVYGILGERLLVQKAETQPPHKIDENMWKNREQIEEILFLLKSSQWPKELQQQSTAIDADLASILCRLKDKFQNTLKILEFFQSRNSEFVFNTVMTYLPQDFRGSLIRQQRERSERNKQAEVDALANSGGSIRDRYALLWKQQMERRRQLAQLGSATGVYKTLVKYLVGVPQVLLDFVRQINDDQGPMEEQRHRYGPPLYSLTQMVLNIRLFLSLWWWCFEARKVQRHQISILEEAVAVYTSEFERFIKFIGYFFCFLVFEVFANSPFFIAAEEAGSKEARKNDDYKEICVPAGKTYEVSLTVESINSFIAWDFSLVPGKLYMLIDASSWPDFDTVVNRSLSITFGQDIGFSVEYINPSGQKTLILPYQRYESDQGNFCTIMAGSYKLIWDNSYSSFFKKALRYKVDCIPTVLEPGSSGTEVTRCEEL